jgi:three-Cys-motif partner protein
VAPQALRFDEIGYWSQLKLEIVKDYATAYSKILANQPRLKHVYIDAFAGAGVHQLKTTGALVPGSPLNALAVEPPFTELHLIDMDGAKVENLRQLTAGRSDVHIHEGNCNEILLRDVFPKVQYRDFKRALCLLDPYGLTLNWTVIAEAAKTKTTEIFLNFPIMDMNRNALWSTPTGVTDADRGRMSAFWGDDSWQKVVYKEQKTLFGGDDLVKDGGNRAVVDAFRRRLREVAGFKEVPEPIPMRNSKGATVYYLFFAAHNTVGAKIARHLMKRYANVGAG